MELLFVFAPGIISTSLLEKLNKQHFSSGSYWKHTILFDFFINFFCVFIYHFINRGENSVIELFYSNAFLMKYALLSILLAVILSIGYHYIAPYVSVTVDTTDEKESRNEEET